MADEKQLEILRRGAKVWNKWREDNSEVEIDLMDADLELAVLKGVNLKEANLKRADLLFASLEEANLIKADLRYANIALAILTKANLSGAYLIGANLVEVGLLGVDLTDSYMGSTMLADTDLSASIGLETITHNGPSTIGTDTIQKSKGKLSVDFLRGCGLYDMEIEFAKLAAPGLDPDQVAQITYEIHRLYCDQPILFHSCFISYNNKDQDFAQRMHDDLQDNGVRCWFAPEDMKIGGEFRKAIGLQIRLRDKLLIILSENSIHSEWVGDEVEKALAEEIEQGMLKLFPIRLDNAVFEARDDWAEKIRLRRHIGDFSNWQDEASYHKSFERLLRDLKAQ